MLPNCAGNAAAQYLPPAFVLPTPNATPPQTIISVPVQIAECKDWPGGASVVLVAFQLSVLGLYLPPVPWPPEPVNPPQTIIPLPVHAAVCSFRAEGALIVLVVVQLLLLGLYLPPLFKLPPSSLLPPQTIISLPVHTAV